MYGWYAVIKKAKPHYYQVSSLLTPPSIRLGYEIIHWKMTLVDRLGRYSIHESAHIMSDHENTLLKMSSFPINMKITLSSARLVKQKRFKKIAWILSHHLHLQWKFKLWVGKFAWGVKAGCCQQTFEFQSRWRWWDWIQATF